MLKHKIRKSRKNILSLLETVQDEEEGRKKKIPEYSEVKKKGKKTKIKSQEIGNFSIYFRHRFTLVHTIRLLQFTFTYLSHVLPSTLSKHISESKGKIVTSACY